jgi:hypothetical protein
LKNRTQNGFFMSFRVWLRANLTPDNLQCKYKYHQTGCLIE